MLAAPRQTIGPRGSRRPRGVASPKSPDTRDDLTPPGSAQVSPRDRGGHEPRDRRPAVHQPQHRRLPPTQSVPQAPSQIPACMPPIITPPRCSSSPPALGGGEQSLPPRSAAIKSARARGLADLIDNLGAALPAAAVFYQPRGLRPNTRRQATCIRVAAQLLGGSPRDAACAGCREPEASSGPALEPCCDASRSWRGARLSSSAGRTPACVSARYTRCDAR